MLSHFYQWRQILTMLENTLTSLERVVADLLEQNQTLKQNCQELEQQLQQAREDNDTLQLTTLEQEEKQAATLARLQALVNRAGNTEAA